MSAPADDVAAKVRDLTTSAPATNAPADPQATPRLRVRKASHAYGKHRALRGVNIDVASGEIYGLLGPNGAGKTTLMRAISGHLELAMGAVSVDGRNPAKSLQARRSIGFVPQQIALYTQLTVRENLEVFGRFAGVRGAKLTKMVATLLDQASLAARANQLCGTLSGGYQRRVNICASILHDPGVLMLDEPTVGIDVDAREAIHRLIKRIRGRGAAIILTTHDLEQAAMLCDRVGILVDGRVRLEGAPDVLVRRAFGTAKEILVTLARPPSPDEATALRRSGLAATDAPVTWSRHALHGDADPNPIMARVSAIGIPVREVRVREPDLATLFVAVLERSQQP